MTAVHVTAAEARALGAGAVAGDGVLSPRRPRQRQTAPGPYASTCHDCGETFTTQAAETRHVAPGHCRYEIPIGTQ